MLKPVFGRFDHDLDHWQWGYKPEDFKKITEGYACAVCWEEWPHWVARCPVCKTETDPNIFFEPPREWVDR